jgi:hypothetical protein
MKLYTIRRRNAWGSPEEVEAIAKRAKEVADSDFPTEVRWIRSYVLADQDGTLGSLCVYQAVDAEAIRRHSHRVGMPADEINEALETVLVRPDPVPASAPAFPQHLERNPSMKPQLTRILAQEHIADLRRTAERGQLNRTLRTDRSGDARSSPALTRRTPAIAGLFQRIAPGTPAPPATPRGGAPCR